MGNREDFYFPFTLEFSQIPILWNKNNTESSSFPRYTRVDKKLTFSPGTNTIFFQCFRESVKFKSISKLKFKLSPFQDNEVTLKYKVEELKLINHLQKQLRRTKVFMCLAMLLCVCLWLATFGSLTVLVE